MDDSGKEVYCGRSEVWLNKGDRNPKVGSRVECDIEQNDKGGRARNVSSIGGGNCEGGRCSGVVKEWDVDNGRGEIEAEDGSLLRVSIGDLWEPSQTLNVNDSVLFDPKQGNTSIYASYVTLAGNGVFQCTLCGQLGHQKSRCTQ